MRRLGALLIVAVISGIVLSSLGHIALFATGAFLSFDKPVSTALLGIHKGAPGRARR